MAPPSSGRKLGSLDTQPSVPRPRMPRPLMPRAGAAGAAPGGQPQTARRLRARTTRLPADAHPTRSGNLEFLQQMCAGTRWNRTASAFDPLTGWRSWVTANVFALSRNAPSGQPLATPRIRSSRAVVTNIARTFTRTPTDWLVPTERWSKLEKSPPCLRVPARVACGFGTCSRFGICSPVWSSIQPVPQE